MDALTIQPALVQTLSVQPKQAPVLPKAPEVSLPVPDASRQAEAEIQVLSAGQKRFEAVQRKAEAIANSRVLGTTTFAIFQDARGVLITRFRDQTTGKVNYVPEPQMLKLGGSPAPAVLNIEA